MFDYRNYYKTLNNKAQGDYNDSLEYIKKIKEKTKDKKKNKYNDYFHRLSSFILTIADFEYDLNEEYFAKNTFDALLQDNHKIYKDITEDNYKTSYANPAYAAKRFGQEVGQVLAYLNAKIRGYVKYAYEHRIFDMAEMNDIVIRTFDYIMGNKHVNTNKLKAIVTSDAKERLILKRELWAREALLPEISYRLDIVTESNLEDLRYIFRYGVYITENEIKMAKFISEMGEDKINDIAKTFTEGYRIGFIRDNKDMSIKEHVGIRFHVGEERIIKQAVDNFKAMNLTSFISILYSNEPNKQFTYDHRFDDALYFDKDYTELLEEATEKSLNLLKDQVKGFAGPAVLEQFGEIPFKPESKEACIKLTDEQSKLKQSHTGKLQMIINQYVPREEYSFTIMALPIPDIGEKFEEIFEDTCKVNTLDSDIYEKIQQTIIDALDQGKEVYVKGKEGNQTDITVALPKLEDPSHQTNFVNCVADVNIPVGEVFTSPKLTGTNGTLHVEEVYLGNLKYDNLILTFKDGFIEEYSCTNFDTDEENKKYIEENLMFPHKTLPLGEFAIGTNTTAYVMANKHGILDILPILIVEKMGPHFAVGDTCFSREEDTPVFNADKKEIIARDNEKSIKRKENMDEAYTYVHTDITLPYDGLELITVIKSSGEKIDIIKDGRFVLDGTEELNKPFKG